MAVAKIKDLGPCLLIAMPQLQDPNFVQTTTLLSEFNQDGALGFILNRPLNVRLSDYLEGDLKDGEIGQLEGVCAYWGGPMQADRGFVLHEDESLAEESVQIARGLYMSGSTNVLMSLAKRRLEPGAKRFKLFLGYAGWGPKQLEVEISQTSWLTSPIDRDLAFSSAARDIWRDSFVKIGVDPNQLAATPQDLAN